MTSHHRSVVVEIVDLADPNHNRRGRRTGVTVEEQFPPVPVSSGGAPHPPPPAGPPKTKFPNNTDLVLDESNSELLSALLPALQKHRCLEFRTEKPNRSPWVRAFCDLYHPTGPWGSNQFSDVPDIYCLTPKGRQRKYKFKSYQVPTLYKQLNKYDGESQDHIELRQALENYYGMEKWHKEFLEGCKAVAAIEVNKPVAERAAIPTVETGVVVVTTAAVAAAYGDAAGEQENSTTEPAPGTGATNGTPGNSSGGRKRKIDQNNNQRSVRPRTRSQRLKESEEEEEEERVKENPKGKTTAEGAKDEEEQSTVINSTKSPPPSASSVKGSGDLLRGHGRRAAVSPDAESSSMDNNNKDDDDCYGCGNKGRKETLEQKRDELVKLLSRRQKGSATKNAISDKIQKQIDKIDEELLDLILG